MGTGRGVRINEDLNKRGVGEKWQRVEGECERWDDNSSSFTRQKF